MIYRHYSTGQQVSLSLFLSEARHAGLANRVAYIEPGVAWLDSGFSQHDATDDEIDTQTTIAGINAVTWDYTDFEATDPLIKIRSARAILN